MILDYTLHALRTVTGFYQKPFSKEWNAKLNLILDNGRITHADAYTITIEHNGDVYDVWVSNKYYAYGNLHRINDKKIDEDLQYRSRFRSMRKLNKACSDFIKADRLERAGVIYTLK